MFVFNQNPSPYLHTPTPPSYTFLNLSASLVSILGDYVPSLSLFSLIKENAIQLSFYWPIASLFFPHIILLFISTIWLPIRHTARVISRDGCGGTCDNDVSPRIFFSQKCTWGYCAAILDEPRYSFTLITPDYKESSTNNQAVVIVVIGQWSTVVAMKVDTIWMENSPENLFFSNKIYLFVILLFVFIVSVWLPLPQIPTFFQFHSHVFFFFKVLLKWRSVFFIPIILTAHYNSRGDTD